MKALQNIAALAFFGGIIIGSGLVAWCLMWPQETSVNLEEAHQNEIATLKEEHLKELMAMKAETVEIENAGQTKKATIYGNDLINHLVEQDKQAVIRAYRRLQRERAIHAAKEMLLREQGNAVLLGIAHWETDTNGLPLFVNHAKD